MATTRRTSGCSGGSTHRTGCSCRARSSGTGSPSGPASCRTERTATASTNASTSPAGRSPETEPVPELPEVQALAERLDAAVAGAPFAGAAVLQFSSLKTFTPRPESLVGATLQRVGRRGKFVVFEFAGEARAGAGLTRVRTVRPGRRRYPARAHDPSGPAHGGGDRARVLRRHPASGEALAVRHPGGAVEGGTS